MAAMRTPKLGTGWNKCPSVMTGGAAWFWFRRSSLGNRQWFGYNRLDRQWFYTIESRRDGRRVRFASEAGA